MEGGHPTTPRRPGRLSLASLEAILQKVTGISATAHGGGGQLFPRGDEYFPGALVKFPGEQVHAFDRVSMWFEGNDIRLGMWPAELRKQYTRVYSDPAKVDALIEFADRDEWTLQPNFQLAHRFARPLQRWYPERRLSGPDYMHQWIDDLQEGRAGGRSVSQVADPSFSDWLVERSYAHDNERGSLQDWLRSKSPATQIHIRPGIQILRTWPYGEAFGADRDSTFIVGVREAIDRVLLALEEPTLDLIQPS